MSDDIVDPHKLVCPHCGKEIEDEHQLPPIFDFNPTKPPENIAIPPRDITYYTDHQVDVELPGRMDRIQATTKAIEIVREYMKTLPEGYKLRQACPRRIVDSDGEIIRSHWVVRCIMLRASKTMDLPWAGLLDLREEGESF